MNEEQVFFQKLIHAFDLSATKKIFAKGEYLIREGEVERNLYFIQSGAVRAFYLSEFEEQTVRFGYEASIINSLSSFLKETPSEFYIEALRRSEVKIISKSDVLQIAFENTETMKQYIALLEITITQQIDREIDLMIASPTERLKRVLQRSPNLFQQVPLKYIASYLRMTPETLSRIRNS